MPLQILIIALSSMGINGHHGDDDFFEPKSTSFLDPLRRKFKIPIPKPEKKSHDNPSMNLFPHGGGPMLPNTTLKGKYLHMWIFLLTIYSQLTKN